MRESRYDESQRKDFIQRDGLHRFDGHCQFVFGYDPDSYKHFLILNGEKVEADLAYTQIYQAARKTIYVVDNYIGLKTLDLLRTAKSSVAITIFSDNLLNRSRLSASILDDFYT